MVTIDDIVELGMAREELFARASDTGQDENDPDALHRINSAISYAESVAENHLKTGGFTLANYENDVSLRSVIVDIAISRILLRKGLYDETMNNRYTNAMDILKAISKGERKPDGAALEDATILVQTRPPVLSNRFDSMP